MKFIYGKKPNEKRFKAMNVKYLCQVQELCKATRVMDSEAQKTIEHLQEVYPDWEFKVKR